MFLGAFTNGLDAKGRVSAPAEFRAAAKAQGAEGLYLWRSFDGPVLEGAGPERMAQIRAAIGALDPYDPARAAFEQVIFGGARLLAFDQTGRITLPREFVEHAGLDGQAVFVGLGDRFEVREPARHEAMFTAALEQARASRAALRASPAPVSIGGAQP